jgi:hypothetical protein
MWGSNDEDHKKRFRLPIQRYQKYYILSPANPERINMKTLALIVILMVSTVVAVASIPQARADGDVVILSHTIFQTEGFPPFSFDNGDYFVAGEVQNVGTEALNFNITADFYDSNNEIVGTAFLSDTLADVPPSYLHVLLPGKKSPFQIYLSRFDEETGDFRLVDHYSLKLTTSQASNFQPGLEILSQSSHEAAGTIFIEGEVKNIGTEYMDGFMVFATFYDKNGEVLAVASEGGSYTLVDASGERGFAPSQTASFSVALEDFREGGRLQQVDRYEVTAEGYDYSLWTADGYLINPETVYVLGSVESPSPSPTPTEEPSQPDDSPLILYAAIAAIGVVLFILTLLVLRKRNRKLQTK